MRRAELSRPLQLRVVDVHRDDRLGAGQPRAEDGPVADAAAADHRNRVAAGHAAGVDRGADAGHHAACNVRAA